MSVYPPDLEPAALEPIRLKGSAWYASLSDALEANHYDQYVAIDVDTGEHAIARSTAEAARQMHKRRPEGRLFLRRIGSTPEPELAHRLFGPYPETTATQK